MGISFLGALGHGGSGFVQGMNDYERRQQMQLANERSGRELDADTAYGNALTGGAQGAQPWDQQRNSIWQKIAGLFGQAQEEQRNPMGATALPEGVQPVQQQPNMFDDVRGMARQEMGMGPAPMPQAQGMPQGMPQGAPQGMPQGPMGAAGPMPPPMQQAAPPRQMGGISPNMSFGDVAQRVAAANPGAPPHVIAGAMDRFRPWMSDEAKVQLRMTQQELAREKEQRQASQGQQGLNIRRDSAANLQGYRQKRLEQLQTKLAIDEQNRVDRQSRFEERLAATNDRDARAKLVREYEQAELSYWRSTQQAINGAGAPGMTDDLLKELQTNQSTWRQRLDELKKGFASQPGGSPYRAPLPSQTRAPAPEPGVAAGLGVDGPLPPSIGARPGAPRPVIQQPGTMTPPPAGPRAGASPKSTMRAEPQQAPAQAPVSTEPPPQALQSLKEGIVTKFGNGQSWTLQNGKPVQVQ